MRYGEVLAEKWREFYCNVKRLEFRFKLEFGIGVAIAVFTCVMMVANIKAVSDTSEALKLAREEREAAKEQERRNFEMYLQSRRAKLRLQFQLVQFEEGKPIRAQIEFTNESTRRTATMVHAIFNGVFTKFRELPVKAPTHQMLTECKSTALKARIPLLIMLNSISGLRKRLLIPSRREGNISIFLE
ncbi:MAG: hypothetical protein ACKVRP_15095 [Bacteroidota bacterium]